MQQSHAESNDEDGTGVTEKRCIGPKDNRCRADRCRRFAALSGHEERLVPANGVTNLNGSHLSRRRARGTKADQL